MYKLRQSLDLKTKLERYRAAFDARLEAAMFAYDEALAKQRLGLPTSLSIANAQSRFEDLLARKEREAMPIKGLQLIIRELESKSKNGTKKIQADRPAKVASLKRGEAWP